MNPKLSFTLSKPNLRFVDDWCIDWNVRMSWWTTREHLFNVLYFIPSWGF